MKNMKIFILTGGFGTRLRTVVSDVPKPMAPILDKPFLFYQIREVKKYFPTTKIYLLTYYLSAIIENYFKNDEFISIIKEKKALGTGGSIKNAINFLNLSSNDTLLVLNGDTFVQPNLSEMLIKKNDDIIMLGSLQENCDRYGVLKINEERIVEFLEKQKGINNKYINAGCYFFNNLTFFNNIEDEIFSIEEEFIKYLKLNKNIIVFKYSGIFIDIGIPEDYKKMIHYIREEYNAKK